MTPGLPRRIHWAVSVPVLVFLASGCSPIIDDSPDIPEAEVAWEYPVEPGNVPAVLTVGDSVLVRTGEALAAVSASSGRESWSVPEPLGAVYVTGTEAVVRTEKYRTVEAVDLSSGERRVLLETSQLGGFNFIAATGDALFVALGHRVTAYDLATMDETWHRDLDADFGESPVTVHAPVAVREPAGPTDSTVDDLVAVAPSVPVLYVNDHPEPDEVTTTMVLDAASGEVVESLAEPLPQLRDVPPLITEEGRVITRRYSSEECAFTVGIDAREEGKAHATVFSARAADGDCGGYGLTPWVSETWMCGGDAEGRAQMVDVATGAVLWQAAKAGGVIGCAEDVVVCVSERDPLLEDDVAEAFDVKSGARLWGVEGGVGAAVHDGLVVGVHLGWTDATTARDLRTGEWRWQATPSRAVSHDLVGFGGGLVFLSDGERVVAVRGSQ